MKKLYCLILSFLLLLYFSFCSFAQVSKSAINDFLNDSAVRTGHAGISIYDPVSKKYLYNYNADKNFLPSSNVKLFTLYAGMKYLGDSIAAMRYVEDDSAIAIHGTGDPTFLHPDFKDQKLFDLLNRTNKRIIFEPASFHSSAFAPGWSWDDYTEDFMAERSSFPVYANVMHYTCNDSGFSFTPKIWSLHSLSHYRPAGNSDLLRGRFYRDPFSNNLFRLGMSAPLRGNFVIPFITSDSLTLALLSDTLHRDLGADADDIIYSDSTKTFHSRPVDSLFRPMMFNSDNFFAEQTLLMVSNERLGYMSDEAIIDTLLANDLKDMPNKPRWVDGSGLSRYDLFSPKDFVYILVKLQNEFGWERMTRILPGAGEGTLKYYYESVPGRIYAKTGSMSNNVSLSGYLITKKNKKLLFSVIINNFTGNSTPGRKAIEKLILSVIDSN